MPDSANGGDINNLTSNTVSPTSNRLTQTQDVTGTANVLYDAAGHITSDGANSFTYSDRGRMSSAVTAGGTVNYLYNGLGQRVAKSGPTAVVNTGAAYYVYDEAGQLLGEYDAAGVPLYETIYLGSLPVGVMKQTGSAASSDIAVNLYNLHADHIATPRVITRQADQAIVWRWDTAEAFGGTMPEQDPSGLGAFTFNQRFPGQVFDAETGLFQNWNREYNARTGRYIQSDPIGLAGGINTFAYVGGNPLSFIDPAGLDAICGDGKTGIPQGRGTWICVPNNEVPDKKTCATAECAAGVLPTRKANPTACEMQCGIGSDDAAGRAIGCKVLSEAGKFLGLPGIGITLVCKAADKYACVKSCEEKKEQSQCK